MNVLAVAVIALFVLVVLLIYAIIRIGRLSNEIQDLMIKRHKLKLAYDILFDLYEKCAKERDLWKRFYSKVKDEKEKRGKHVFRKFTIPPSERISRI